MIIEAADLFRCGISKLSEVGCAFEVNLTNFLVGLPFLHRRGGPETPALLTRRNAAQRIKSKRDQSAGRRCAARHRRSCDEVRSLPSKYLHEHLGAIDHKGERNLAANSRRSQIGKASC